MPIFLLLFLEFFFLLVYYIIDDKLAVFEKEGKKNHLIELFYF